MFYKDSQVAEKLLISGSPSRLTLLETIKDKLLETIKDKNRKKKRQTVPIGERAHGRNKRQTVPTGERAHAVKPDQMKNDQDRNDEREQSKMTGRWNMFESQWGDCSTKQLQQVGMTSNGVWSCKREKQCFDSFSRRVAALNLRL